MPALLPFAPALGLLLSPVLLDLSLLFPALGPVIRWMPVTPGKGGIQPPPQVHSGHQHPDEQQYSSQSCQQI